MYVHRGTFTLALFAASLLTGCASNPLQSTGDTQELIEELPQDLRRKYEIVEVAPIPEPEKAPEPPKETKKTKKKAFKFPDRRPKIDPVLPGEKATYEMTYFGAVAGVFTMKHLPQKIMNGRKVYHFHLHAESTKLFSLFYSLDDTVDSFFDYEGLFSHRFQMHLDETKQKRNSLELYDSEKGEVFYWNRHSKIDHPFEEKKVTEKIEPFPQDLLTSTYYLRFVKVDENHSVSFPVVSDGKSLHAVVTFVRRETLDTVLGKIKTVVLTPTTTFEGRVTHKGNIHMWFTDDDRRLPVLLEAQVRIGAVRAVLTSYEPGATLSPGP